jgi:hypothetical protein
MNIEETIKVYKVAGGQPHNYADTQSVYLVEFYQMRHFLEGKDWKYEMVLNDTRIDKGWNAESHEAELVKKALVIVGLEKVPFKPDRADDDWHMSYIDYAKYIGPGTVTIRYVTPYTD